MAQHDWMSDEDLSRRLKGLYDYEQVEVPKIAESERLLSAAEVVTGYTDAQARVEAERCMQCQDPPCVAACPAHLDIPGYCEAIADGDLDRGLAIVLEAFPIPGSCARVCYHPCTDVCLKGVEGTPIEIPRLRRYITDNTDQHAVDFAIPEETGQRIAVVGSGPAGLSCAYHLRRRGHQPVIYEQFDKAGGTLNTIPDYRLPDDVLQDEIEVLREMGVAIRPDSPVSGDGCLDELLSAHDAVFVSAGAVKAREVPIEGSELEGVHHGYHLLKRQDAGESLFGRKAAIVGGGDVAMDALRSALRTCDEIHLIYRRSPMEMPANPEEVFEMSEEVLQQGWHHLAVEISTERRVERFKQIFHSLESLTLDRMAEVEKNLTREMKAETFDRLDKRVGPLAVHFMATPTRVMDDGGGRAGGLELVRMELGEPDEDGRRRPVAIEGSEFTLDVDTVVFAIGQQIDADWLGRDHGLDLEPDNRISVDAAYRASRPGVYAGGDAMRGPASMIEAMGDGRWAAEAIDADLRATGDGA